MNRFPWRLIAPACLFLCSLAPFAPPAFAQSGQGQWQTLPYTALINPIHAVLLHNGKVLIVSGSGASAGNTSFQAALWDPQAGTITTQPVAWDMFCNGMVVLPDGRPFVIGGNLGYNPFRGELRTSTYDPATNTFTEQQSMAHGRWYPTGTVLSDGRVMAFSGLDETGGTNTSVEFYSPSSGWSAAFSASWTPPLYPRMHLLPNGIVFYSGPSTRSSLFNPATHNWTTFIAYTNYIARGYGSSVLLPLTPANNYTPKVMIMGGASPSTSTTEIIDLSAPAPKWVYGPNMSQPRIQMNATILPSGQVLALGGSGTNEDITTASLNADLYDPVSNTFSPAGAEAYARLYHSVSLLLPDATVWVAGSNPEQGTYEPHMEIYSPPYLFNADGTPSTRPTITSTSSSVIGYGGAFQVQTPDAANVSSVVLMRNGAVTHSFDMEQRYVGLSFTSGAGVLNVTGPPKASIAPPGYYMLFILNNAGVPSTATIVQVPQAANDVPPTGTITSPTSDVSLYAGESVSYSGTGSDPDGTINTYFWSFPGGKPSFSNLANPGSVTYATPGTYVTDFTVTDNLGLTDPNPPSRTVSVLPNFTLSVTPALQNVVQGRGTSFTTKVTAGTGFSGTVSLTVNGLPAGATASFSPASISTSGSSTMSVSTSSSTVLGVYPLTITGTNGSLTHTVKITLVVKAQIVTKQSNAGNPITNLTISPSGTGHLIAVAMMFNGSTSVASVSDNATGGSNTYVSAGAKATAGKQSTEIWYAVNSKSGATVVTPRFAGSPTHVEITVWEVFGISTLPPDVTNVSSGSVTLNNTPGPAVTTTQAGDFILSVLFAIGTNFTTISSGNEFTNDFRTYGNGWAHITSTSATASTHQASWYTPSPTGIYCASTVAFRPTQ